MQAFRKLKPPIQSALPRPGLTPLELAHDLVERIEQGTKYARIRKRRFRARSVILRILALMLSATSTVILGLQNLNPWTGTAFALVAVVTVVNVLEPFFAWRSLWVLMEEGQYKFYRLRDELTYYIASTPPEELDQAVLRERFDQYQAIWDLVGNSWLKYRQADKAN
ncbi:SLATT domain-containing protein [Amycolatopsis thailandensis]|uniref:SLATT domain-containing protein n=1 Tax=Amycolatopsis thailandensis TaxID=589330 RepID=UPI0036472769